MSWRLKRIRTIAAIYMSSADLLSIQFSMVGVLHEGPQKKKKKKKKQQQLKIGGWALAQRWTLAQLFSNLAEEPVVLN